METKIKPPADGDARQRRRRRSPKGRQVRAGLGSAKGSNEEVTLFQKSVRLGFGRNNIDRCARLRHACGVAALLEGLGSAAAWCVPAGQQGPVKGLTVVEVIKSIAAGGVKGPYVMGENRAMSDPDANQARTVLAQWHMPVVAQAAAG